MWRIPGLMPPVMLMAKYNTGGRKEPDRDRWNGAEGRETRRNRLGRYPCASRHPYPGRHQQRSRGQRHGALHRKHHREVITPALLGSHSQQVACMPPAVASHCIEADEIDGRSRWNRRPRRRDPAGEGCAVRHGGERRHRGLPAAHGFRPVDHRRHKRHRSQNCVPGCGPRGAMGASGRCTQQMA